jgi:hypothetical protein
MAKAKMKSPYDVHSSAAMAHKWLKTAYELDT